MVCWMAFSVLSGIKIHDLISRVKNTVKSIKTESVLKKVIPGKNETLLVRTINLSRCLVQYKSVQLISIKVCN